ncbi:MAG: aminomethyltransferase family protein [Pseudomonadota bacterium]
MKPSLETDSDLVASRPGAAVGALSRHPFHAHERPMGPHYCVYNRRFMVVCFDSRSVEDGYWLLRQRVGLLHTGELPLEIKGPDAETLLNRLFTRDVSKLKTGRCGYGLACYEDGGLLVDGILMRLAPDRFWYVQADGDFYGWARAHAIGMDVEISDPGVYVSQVQGPNALKLLDAMSDGGLPAGFGYYGIATVRLGGQSFVITRTGFTNELGWEFYTEPHHDVDALWALFQTHGAPLGLDMAPVDAFNIRRIEAGILNAGSDFNRYTTPYDVGLGRFVDEDTDFIGRPALRAAPKARRLYGFKCFGGEVAITGAVERDGARVGSVCAEAVSPLLGQSIGYVLLDSPEMSAARPVQIGCRDGSLQAAELLVPPFYDRTGAIPRGKQIDIPVRP